MRSWFLTLLAALLLLLPPFFLWRSAQPRADLASLRTVDAYLKSAYARDFKAAYRFISQRDRQLKPERAYIRERGPFQGFPLEITRKLADFIETQPVEFHTEGDESRIRLHVKYPDAGSLSTLLLDWDESRLNELSPSEQRTLLDRLDEMKRAGQIRTVEGQEQFTLLREGRSWRIYFDWAAGVRVHYHAQVPSTQALEAVPVDKATTIRPDEPFTIAYRVKNRTRETIATRIIHHIEPGELEPYLDIVDCALLLPVQLAPGQESEFSTTYLVRGDLPDSAREFEITYEFEVL